ncbi:ADP-ribosylation factor-like protein 16 isoform X2 [Thunnus maccoyii]|uniref:ADP-ribosylation factor-like protein 16 isoform X2 n=1 Tax=Thunnus maccoyii TaxID=8240 RepID=UPI001C4B2996|nr:ADP-ribosylation factor-like protein 16 isoform X2 [Thunnus maccoyii]
MSMTYTSYRLIQLNLHGSCELGAPPSTLPTVGTNLTDLTLKRKKVTVRELGGCMGPIWPSYFKDCSSVIFMVDSSNIAQISSSCIQLLSVLSAEPLHSASVLILFNKRDMPCTMSLVEVKSLFRMDDIIASATQPITILELSARSGEGLQEVLSWLESITVK